MEALQNNWYDKNSISERSCNNLRNFNDSDPQTSIYNNNSKPTKYISAPYIREAAARILKRNWNRKYSETGRPGRGRERNNITLELMTMEIMRTTKKWWGCIE